MNEYKFIWGQTPKLKQTVKYPLQIFTEKGTEILLVEIESDIAIKLLENDFRKLNLKGFRVW